MHIRPLCRLSAEEYVEKKKIYDSHLTELRKQWQADYQAQLERQREEKRLEVEKTILRKAVRLREKRTDAARRSEVKRINQQKANLAYREHLARVSVRAAQRDEVREARFEKLLENLQAESKYWLTPDNYTDMITDDLFKKPSSTGVVDKSSELWRHYIKPFGLNRLLQQVWENPSEGDSDSLQMRLEKRAHKTTIRQDNVRHLINGMIGTGHDRERYEEFVEQFSAWQERTEGSDRTRHLAKYADHSNVPDVMDMTKQDLMDMLGNPLDEFENKQLKKELDAMIGDGQRMRDLAPNGAGGDGAAPKKDLFPLDEYDDEDSDDAVSDSDDERAVGRPDAAGRAAKRGVARAAHAEEVWARLEQDIEDSDSDEALQGTDSFDDHDSDQDEVEADGAEAEHSYASAEPSSVDELIEDLAFVDPNDEAALKLMYQKIRLQSLNQERF